ncbi:hypothetical protein MRX96_004755 [Rhipicephalus microplus]
MKLLAANHASHLLRIRGGGGRLPCSGQDLVISRADTHIHSRHTQRIAPAVTHARIRAIPHSQARSRTRAGKPTPGGRPRRRRRRVYATIKAITTAAAKPAGVDGEPPPFVWVRPRPCSSTEYACPPTDQPLASEGEVAGDQFPALPRCIEQATQPPPTRRGAEGGIVWAYC